MKDIKFLDIGYLYQKHKKELDDSYFKVMNSGFYIRGPELSAFEKEFAKYSGGSYCVGVGNGLDAIVLSLRALGVKEGDEVIVPSFTFIATWFAVSNIGAIPIAVDVDINSYNIDVTKIEKKITSKTKAILAVYLYGLPAYIDSINAIAKKHNIYFVADAAQAHGSQYKNNKIGGLADITCFSFYPGKNLGAIGDGGAIVTNNKDLADKVRTIGNYGSSKKYYHDEMGVNSRLDELQAGFLRVKLKYLDQWNKKRNEQAKIYKDLLNTSKIAVQIIPDDYVSAYHLFVVSSDERDELQEYLFENKIETITHYPISINKSDAYINNKNIDINEFINAEKAAKKLLSLPLGPHLEESDISYVANVINSY
ncbi:dTDP-3-amino-3,6-dideoxy-alpha-D-galactopyranose transaminase [Candidatus Arcanobacter lacustris]|uniref:dTDP-3-amino-3,6-dideoxy-alpha-D-galactopyranose transaminase n=1 Tax=Candidatus Arcanibacter lacustris TaxID=1607817 RepID=A0A0F5MRC3_9RICK|nr:dTDP-3-amino-3,6-dideoxy-alpha-D-galactopyranose transaminase [Candidatus Arcanobacter lacustris]KKB96627.1 dTDP-3-amino-3,6-dideoxy-alpha-D-galactopyranose transaminase [Candidatus Arcanobacter lacustris]